MPTFPAHGLVPWTGHPWNPEITAYRHPDRTRALVLVDTSGRTVTVTLPPADAGAADNTARLGSEYLVLSTTGANEIRVFPTLGETINGSGDLWRITGAHVGILFKVIAPGQWIAVRDVRTDLETLIAELAVYPQRFFAERTTLQLLGTAFADVTGFNKQEYDPSTLYNWDHANGVLGFHRPATIVIGYELEFEHTGFGGPVPNFVTARIVWGNVSFMTFLPGTYASASLVAIDGARGSVSRQRELEVTPADFLKIQVQKATGVSMTTQLTPEAIILRSHELTPRP